MDDVSPGRLVVVSTSASSPRSADVRASATAVDPAGADPAAVVAAVADGSTVALRTDGPDAATAAVVGAVVDAGLLVEVAPGPDRAVAALVASGLPTDRFAVDPALPPAGPEREARLAELAASPRTTVLPAPDGRATLASVATACGPDRQVAVAAGARLWRGPVGEAGEAAIGPPDGAWVVVVGPAPDGPRAPADDDAVRSALAEARGRGLSPSRAAAEVAAATGRPRREVYALGAEGGAPEDGTGDGGGS